MKAIKYDQNKPRWCLLNMRVMEEVVHVLTFGAKKYSDDNWIKVPKAKQRYYDALQRHATAYQTGEKKDPESGRSHLAHLMCCAIYLLYFEMYGGEKNVEKRSVI